MSYLNGTAKITTAPALSSGDMKPVTTTLPQGEAEAGGRGPMLHTTHLISGSVVDIHWGGALHTYRLAQPMAPAVNFRPLVLVRIERACPSLAEIYAIDLHNHRYLGTARRQPA